MAQEVINVGSAPNDGTGDPLRTAYQKCNSNFGELFSRAQQSVPGSLVGSINDQAGMYAYDATYFYYCFQDYDGSSEIWAQVTNIGNVTIPRIINGTSSVDIAAPDSDVTISVNGVSNVAVFSNVGVTHNNLTILGNTVVGNVTPQADATYSLGTANVGWQSLYVESVVTQQIDYANSTVGIGDDSNVTISVDGVSNVAVFSPTHTDFSNVIITGNLAVTGDTTAGNIIPNTDVTYDLGSPSNKWRSLYLAGNTIYLGSAEITSTESSITLSSGSGAEFTISGDSAANTVGSFGEVEATGNIVGNVVLANSMVTTTDISASGNIIANGFFIGTVLGNITGNFVIPGATTEVVYNSDGVADASSDFTYNNASKLLTVNGNIAANTVSVAAVTASGNVSAANLIGTLSTAAQPSITSVGTLTGLAVTGNISVTENISATNISGTLTTGSQTNITSVGILSSLSVSGNLAAADGSFTTIAGNGRSLTGLDASSLSTGIVASERLSGNYSIAVSTAATVTTAAQPNITSVGTLTSLSVTGNVTTGNISGTTGAFTTVTGNGRALTSINASNLDTGTVPQDRLSGLYNISVISANTSFSAATVSASAQPSITSLGVLTSLSVSGNTTSGNLTTGILTVDTVTAATQISTPVIAKTGSNGTGNIGSSVNYFNTVFAKATSAQYADLAEQYLSDANYNPGTVVKFGGTQEVTLADQDNDPLIAGVVSSNPAYLMNSGLIGQYVIAVALAGRVPCQVQGPIRKGQMIVSAGNGYGRAAVKPEIGTVIGKALENFDGETGIIEVVVGRL